MKKLTVFVLVFLAASISCLAADYTPVSLEGMKQTSATVTNGQAVTLSAGINFLTASGQADGFTNTITLVAADNDGVQCWVINSQDSSNLIAVASSGTLESPAIELSAGELSIFMSATDGTDVDWYAVQN